MQHATTLTRFLAAMTVAGTTYANDNNIDLSTIPERASVQLTIYNAEDITLVRETRRITFRPGMNPLQFSWANTLIDPSSVELRFLSHADQLDVVDTTYPHDKPQMLYWNIDSEVDGEAELEITYFTSGITWAADYVCTTDEPESSMTFEGFVRITNQSGEDYDNAQVRLVVGTINLVEKIADLARRGLITRQDADDYREGRRKAMSLDQAGELRDHLASRMERSAGASAPKEIVKEGLSEYFIFTVEGEETVPHTWSKRLRLFQGLRVPFDVVHRYRPREYGQQLVRLFVLRNETASQLGESPLPDGMVRLFRENGRDGLAFLAATPTKYVPIGQAIEIVLGPDPAVVHERVRLRSWRDGFWFQEGNTKTYFSMDQKRQSRRPLHVAGWDEHQDWIERVRNHGDKPIAVEIRRSFEGDVTVKTDVDVKSYDFQTIELTATIDAQSKAALNYEATRRQGINEKQQRVEVR